VGLKRYEALMTRKVRLEILDRREFVICAAVMGMVAEFIAATTSASAQDKTPSWEELFKKIVGDGKPIEGKIVIDVPEIAENGNTVPFTLKVESPMTEHDFVKAIHILSTGNPQANVASFFFTPLSGKAAVSGRMRLAKTQDIISLAELSDGKVLMGKRTVKVTIGGCGG
jgi:sulfur-oxidizing protein SoxY